MNVSRMNIQCCSLPSLILLLSIVVLAGSCSQTGFNSNNNKDDDGGADLTDDRNPGDDRPTDEGEGLPGYLVDPEAIVVAFNESRDKAKVAAPEATVAGGTAKTFDLELLVWQIDTSVLTGQLASKDEVLRFPAKLVSRIPVKSDGSFQSESPFELNPLKPLIFSVDRKGAADDKLVIPLGGKPTAVFRQPGEGESITEFKQATSGALSRDDQLVLECIENWNTSVFPRGELPEYKTLVGFKYEGILPPIAAREYTEDEEETSSDALILVKQRGTIINGFIELKNPNGWYCLDVAVTSIMRYDVTGCNKGVDKSHVSVALPPNAGVNVVPGC